MKFTPEDCDVFAMDNEVSKAISVDRANALLQAWLSERPVVYGLFLSNGQHSWQEVQGGPQTHTAKLVCVESLKGDE